jgi:hypothetical protein
MVLRFLFFQKLGTLDYLLNLFWGLHGKKKRKIRRGVAEA